MEALGAERQSQIRSGDLRLGIVFVTICGAVQYSNRFYGEVLENPATASPILFPETVYNSASSHLSAILGTQGLNYTLVGDTAEFHAGLKLAGQWIHEEDCDGCLVVGAEELDWVSAEAMQLFHRRAIASEGAGAVFLERSSDEDGIRLVELVGPVTFLDREEKRSAASAIRDHLGDPPERGLLVSGAIGHSLTDRAERDAWAGFPGRQLQPALVLGNALAASAALQVVAACELLRSDCVDEAVISTVGHHHQCLGARLANAGV